MPMILSLSQIIVMTHDRLNSRDAQGNVVSTTDASGQAITIATTTNRRSRMIVDANATAGLEGANDYFYDGGQTRRQADHAERLGRFVRDFCPRQSQLYCGVHNGRCCNFPDQEYIYANEGVPMDESGDDDGVNDGYDYAVIDCRAIAK